MSEFNYEEYADIVIAYGLADGNTRAAQRMYRELHPDRRVPHHNTFSSTFRRLRETGNLAFREPGVNARNLSVFVDEDILRAFDNDPTTSVRKVARDLGLSVWKVWSVINADGRDPFHYTQVQVQNGKEKELPPTKDLPEQNDIIRNCIGILGRWQIWVCIVIFLVKFPVAWHQLSIVFLAPPIHFECIDNATAKCSSECPSYVYDRSVFTSTITTEWDLVCDKQYLGNLAQTITMLGILFGNMLFGYLSDKYGRRCPLVLAVIIQAVSGLGAAFSPWFWGFLIMRFLSALATGGTMITSFVLIMEIVGTEWRTIIGILYQIPFNLGHLMLPAIGYYIRDWRYFQATISAPSLALVVYYWILPESPRWQLAVGKTKLAIETLKKAAKGNQMPTDNIEQDVNNYLQNKDVSQNEHNKGNIMDLVRTPIIRTYTIAICFNWLVCGLCFFGVSQFIGQLGGNIFINVALSAIIQIPGSLFACWSTKEWGRKKTLIFANIVAGVSLLLIGFVPNDPVWIKSTLSTIGMFGLALAFPTAYIYSGELFPTVIRNIGVGTSSMCARIGSMIAPFIATLNTVDAWIPPVIFGVVPLIGAILCLQLPETLDCKLPDTIEEAEKYAAKKKVDSHQLELNG